MKRSFIALSALSVLASMGMSVAVNPNGTYNIATNRNGKTKPAQTSAADPRDSKAIRRAATGYVRRHRAPRGKRYSASVRQHQRHAAKARNRAASR